MPDDERHVGVEGVDAPLSGDAPSTWATSAVIDFSLEFSSAGTRRFTELRKCIDGISQRMLTVTLRGLERDGIVSRTMYPVMPPRVDYSLTPMGHTLVDAVSSLIDWSVDHLKEIDAARDEYDAREEQARKLS